jgi:hypothetical protein
LATTKNFTTTWSGTPPQSGYTLRAHVFLQNVNQSAPTGATGIGESLYNPVTTPALITNYGDMVFLGATCGNAGTYTLNNGFIEGKDQNVSPNLTGVTGYKSAYGFNETPSATYSGGINQQMIIGFVVNSSPPDPNKASNPVPFNESNDVSIFADLSWVPPTAYTPTSYDVYLGTNPDAHSNPKNTVDTNSYDPPGDLELGTTYYWAIDSNDDGIIYAGDDWSFTTTIINPYKATNPNPSNGAIHVPLSSVLSWDPPTAYTPTSYDVYFGTNPDAHSNPVTTVYTNSYDPPGDLAIHTIYYWAIDPNDDGTIHTGDDWSFTTQHKYSD